MFSHLNGGSSPAGEDYGLSYDILKDCEMIIGQVLRAFNNPSKLKFTDARGKSDILSLSSLGNRGLREKIDPLPEYRDTFQ